MIQNNNHSEHTYVSNKRRKRMNECVFTQFPKTVVQLKEDEENSERAPLKGIALAIQSKTL